jgi:hypothetical protein
VCEPCLPVFLNLIASNTSGTPKAERRRICRSVFSISSVLV